MLETETKTETTPATLTAIKWAAFNFAAALTERDSTIFPAGVTPDRYEIAAGRGYWKLVKVCGSSRYASAFIRKTDGRIFRAKTYSSKGRDLRLSILEADPAKAGATGEPRA
jgi:hypothetical protein